MKEISELIVQKDPLAQKKLKQFRIIATVFLSVVFVALFAGQASGLIANTAVGVAAQFQTMVSIFLVTAGRKYGLHSALLLNLFSGVCVAMLVVAGKTPLSSLAGTATAAVCFMTCTIIYQIIKRLDRTIAEVEEKNGEMLALTEEAEEAYEEARIINDELIESNAIIKENEERFFHMAYYDIMTNLPNRTMIVKKIDEYIEEKKQKFFLIFIDIDDFKMINDTKGHTYGDIVIKTISSRLADIVGQDGFVGRLGGDEFAIIDDKNVEETSLVDFVEQIRAELGKRIVIEDTEIHFHATFGVSSFPEHGTSSGDIIQCADVALYEAKNRGKRQFVIYEPYMKNKVIERNEYENSLVCALLNSEFYMMYQPQFATDGVTLRGFEALIRWNSPDKGTVSPSQFIPIVEENGLILKLGRWIIRECCMKLKTITTNYCGDVIMSINISAMQFREPNFIGIVKDIMQETGVEGKNLEFEITESIFINSVENVKKTLNELKALGITIALDDFGTGFSSLSYLRNLPIDTLKIDKSFVDNIGSNSKDKDIVGSIIDLAHGMNMRVVAEGVESEQQLKYLDEKHCETIQGFLFSKPLSSADCSELVKRTAENKVK